MENINSTQTQQQTSLRGVQQWHVTVARYTTA